MESFDFRLLELGLGNLETFLNLILGVGTSLQQTLLEFGGIWGSEEDEACTVVDVLELLNSLG